MRLGKILSMQIGSGEGAKPLTFQKALSVLLLIPAVFLLLVAYFNESIDNQLAVRIWFWALFSSSIFFAGWHMWGTSTKRNIYPDVLATFLDRKALFEAGPVQLSFIVFQRENQLNIIVLVQNLHDAATEVQMNFLVEFSSQSSPMIFPSLKCDVGASSVIIADYGYPCSPKQLQGQLVKITPTITTKAKQNSRVRFNQRQVFDTKVKLWLSYLMLVGPTVIFSGERFYTLRLNPVAQGKATSVLRPWTVQEVWSPVIRKPKEDIIKIIDSRMGEATP